MKTRLIYLQIATCLFLLANACMGPEPESIEFQEVTMETPVPQGEIGAVILTGETVGTPASLLSHGFLMSTKLADIEQNKGDILPGDPVLNSKFQHHITGLSLDSIYFFKAWAEYKDENVGGTRKVYSSHILPFSFTIKLGIKGSQVSNDTARMIGFITGLQVQGVDAAIQHGFIYSPDSNAVLNIQQVGNSPTELGTLYFNGDFWAEEYHLPFNTRYYFKSYAVTAEGKTYFSEDTGVFEVKDGWVKMAEYPSFALMHGFGAAANGDGYFLGSHALFQTDCSITSPPGQNMWKYDPSANNGGGTWTDANSGYESSRVYNGIAFVLNDIFYCGTGEQSVTEPPNAPYLNFFRIPVSSIGTQELEIFFANDTVAARSSAVAFTLHGKAYFGTGLSHNFKHLNDFWEYNPETGIFRPVARMPFQQSPVEPKKYNIGRAEALAYSDGNFGYVGGGAKQLEMLKDFWVFTPPESSQDTGKWTLLGFFPGPGRVNAVCVEIGGKGYFGTGYNFHNGLLNDWWRIDPTSDEIFMPMQPVPGYGREAAAGMSIGGNAYFGMGWTRVLENGGSAIQPLLLQDMWRYVPPVN